MWLITNSLETDDIQRNVGFLGADRSKLKKELSVVSDQKGRCISGEHIGDYLT